VAYRSRTKVGVGILRFEGDLSVGEMVKMKNRLTRLLNKNHKHLLFDLRYAKNVELAGLGMLVDRLRSIRAQKGDIKLCNLRPEVKNALHMIGVNGLIESFPTEEEAIRSFAA